MSAYYPQIVKTSRELYLHKGTNCFVCGVRVHSELRIADTETIECITTNHSKYLVLESSVMGDYDRYAELLLSFARDNGMVGGKEGIFAVYDAKESYDRLGIKMYCPIKS